MNYQSDLYQPEDYTGTPESLDQAIEYMKKNNIKYALQSNKGENTMENNMNHEELNLEVEEVNIGGYLFQDIKVNVSFNCSDEAFIDMLDAFKQVIEASMQEYGLKVAKCTTESNAA